MAKKPLLDATSRPPTKYSDFTRNYRMSANFEDRRAESKVGMGSGSTIRQTGGEGGGSTGRAKNNQSTPDDFGGSDLGTGGFSNQGTTPHSTRKVDAAEAIERTHFER